MVRKTFGRGGKSDPLKRDRIITSDALASALREECSGDSRQGSRVVWLWNRVTGKAGSSEGSSGNHLSKRKAKLLMKRSYFRRGGKKPSCLGTP